MNGIRTGKVYTIEETVSLFPLTEEEIRTAYQTGKIVEILRKNSEDDPAFSRYYHELDIQALLRQKNKLAKLAELD